MEFLLKEDPSVFLALSCLALSFLFCLLFIARSIWLKKPIDADSMRLYAVFLAIGVIGALSFEGRVGTDVISTIIGAVIGFLGGTRVKMKGNP